MARKKLPEIPASTVRPIVSASNAVRKQFAIARALRAIALTEADAKAAIERINVRKASRLAALQARVVRYSRELVDFFRRHRTELTQGARAILEGGSCTWSPGSLRVEVIDEEAAIKWLEKHDKKALRRKVEINKEYLHDHPDLVKKAPGLKWNLSPKEVLVFTDIPTRVEHDTENDAFSIVVPKEKK